MQLVEGVQKRKFRLKLIHGLISWNLLGQKWAGGRHSKDKYRSFIPFFFFSLYSFDSEKLPWSFRVVTMADAAWWSVNRECTAPEDV